MFSPKLERKLVPLNPGERPFVLELIKKKKTKKNKEWLGVVESFIFLMNSLISSGLWYGVMVFPFFSRPWWFIVEQICFYFLPLLFLLRLLLFPFSFWFSWMLNGVVKATGFTVLVLFGLMILIHVYFLKVYGWEVLPLFAFCFRNWTE